MKKRVRIEGTPFTQRRHTSVQFETPDEARRGLSAWAERLNDPWEQQRPLIESINASLKSEIDAYPPGHEFRARRDAGWYLSELSMHARIVDEHIAKGSASWAAQHGALFGGLWSELQLKLAREELFLLGKRFKDKSDEGVAQRRRGLREDRVREVEDRPSGVPKRQVFRRIAKREGVTWQAIEADYYSGKKSP
jgi:hypothetical protein